MKRSLLFLLTLFLSSTTFAQDFQWAYTAGLPTRSHTVAVRQSPNKNYCLAVYTDSSTFRSSSLFMYNASQQLLWSKNFVGKVTLRDVEICSDNSILAVFPDIEQFLEEDIVTESFLDKITNQYLEAAELPQFELISIDTSSLDDLKKDE